MLIVDDLLVAPVKGLIWVFEEIQKSATAEQRARRDEIMDALSVLYRALEQGEITDAVFDTREQALLDELDALDAREDADELDADADEVERQDPDDEDASAPGRATEVFAEALRRVGIQQLDSSDQSDTATPERPKPTKLDEDSS
ncbi:MAG: hypothetical protein EOM22_09015 [Gammaproteobacteria bacterium]|nr:hypothetical protein [Gammaproteobacteria bacterium]